MWKCSLFQELATNLICGQLRTGGWRLVAGGAYRYGAFDDGRWTRDPFTLTEHDGKLTA